MALLATHINLLDPRKLLPRLLHKRLVNRNPRRRHTPIHRLENLERLLESRLQTLLLGDVRLDVQRFAAERRCPGVEFRLVDGSVLDVPDGDVAAHFADGARDGEADALGAAGDDVGAVGELEGGADAGGLGCHFFLTFIFQGDVCVVSCDRLILGILCEDVRVETNGNYGSSQCCEPKSGISMVKSLAPASRLAGVDDSRVRLKSA